MESKAETLRKKLVKELVKNKAIRSQKVKRAFQKVPRHLFLRGIDLKKVYGDFSIITKKIGVCPMSSSTQPSLMASMLENLQLWKGMKVLEIGTGTGYNAAILSEIIQDPKKVFTIDIDPDTVKNARSNLTKTGYRGITIKCLDGTKGLPIHSPYDRIIVTCSVKDFPESWIKQLKEGGIIVAPIGVNGAQITPALLKQGGILISFSTTLGGFMEMRSKTYQELLTERTGLSKKLLVCTEHPEFFDEDKIISLLRKGHKERALPSKGITLFKRYDFFVFLSLHEKKSVELSLEEEEKDFGFEDSAIGIVDLKRESACLISKNCRLLTYGNNYAYKIVLSLADKWDDLKKPGVDRLQIFVYPRGVNQPLIKNDIFFEKKSESTRLVIKILQS
ncbi:MAG: methyltransferase domain-containing protein [Candidatus Nealsonbacteria bacterium]|nr:MAG: methyltransferase domain-containing protein [Candidatus Nealsonbacteria bacterium]